MINKTFLVIGAAVTLVSSPVVGVELDKKARAEFCKEQAAPIGQELRAFAAARRNFRKAQRDFNLAVKSKDEKLTASAYKEKNRWRDAQETGLKRIDRFAARWTAFCK
ncbi:MAG: hypothetical protein CMM76_12335 [Rhodospirillaceae bacterium]|nr:hypothetical protein [Rhodospirillaceae bacterium]|tara:strand:+ start:255 stop:578 length:324 start_codon:yes stop_codon:yes gene_type:complete